jgi:hypothetical protein
MDYIGGYVCRWKPFMMELDDEGAACCLKCVALPVDQGEGVVGGV